MAYPETCRGALDALEDMRLVAWAYADDGHDHAWDAYVHYYLNQDHEAIYDLYQACESLSRGIKNHAGMVEPFYPLSPLEWYLTYCTEGGVITYDMICEAWAKDEFKGRGLTISFIDRMRQLLWDEEFSVRWAARPETPEE